MPNNYPIPAYIFESAQKHKSKEGVPGYYIFIPVDVFEKIKMLGKEPKDSVPDQVEFEGYVNFTTDRSEGKKTFITFQLSKKSMGGYINQKCYTYHKSHVEHIGDRYFLKVRGTLKSKTLDDGRTFENLEVDEILSVNGEKPETTIKSPHESLKKNKEDNYDYEGIKTRVTKHTKVNGSDLVGDETGPLTTADDVPF